MGLRTMGENKSFFDFLRVVNKTPTVLIAILALTFYLRLLYFGQYIDADVGNAGYQAWRLAEGEVVIDHNFSLG